MNYSFDVYNKYSGNYVGSTEAPNPKTAAQELLGGPLATNRDNAEQQPDEIIAIDDDTFEISIAGTEYTIKKSTKNPPSD